MKYRLRCAFSEESSSVLCISSESASAILKPKNVNKNSWVPSKCVSFPLEHLFFHCLLRMSSKSEYLHHQPHQTILNTVWNWNQISNHFTCCTSISFPEQMELTMSLNVLTFGSTTIWSIDSDGEDSFESQVSHQQKKKPNAKFALQTETCENFVKLQNVTLKREQHRMLLWNRNYAGW